MTNLSQKTEEPGRGRALADVIFVGAMCWIAGGLIFYALWIWFLAPPVEPEFSVGEEVYISDSYAIVSGASCPLPPITESFRDASKRCVIRVWIYADGEAKEVDVRSPQVERRMK